MSDDLFLEVLGVQIHNFCHNALWPVVMTSLLDRYNYRQSTGYVVASGCDTSKENQVKENDTREQLNSTDSTELSLNLKKGRVIECKMASTTPTLATRVSLRCHRAQPHAWAWMWVRAFFAPPTTPLTLWRWPTSSVPESDCQTQKACCCCWVLLGTHLGSSKVLET